MELHKRMLHEHHYFSTFHSNTKVILEILDQIIEKNVNTLLLAVKSLLIWSVIDIQFFFFLLVVLSLQYHKLFVLYIFY